MLGNSTRALRNYLVTSVVGTLSLAALAAAPVAVELDSAARFACSAQTDRAATDEDGPGSAQADGSWEEVSKTASSGPPWGNTPLAEAIARAAGKVAMLNRSAERYTIGHSDALEIAAIRLVPQATYRIEPGDTLALDLANPLPGRPLVGGFSVDAAGRINLLGRYGTVNVVGLTVAEAHDALRRHLAKLLPDPRFTLGLESLAGEQKLPLTGHPQQETQHQLEQDGTINLGRYGTVFVEDMTIAQATAAVEKQLAKTFADPRVAIDIPDQTNWVYYIITQEIAAEGSCVVRTPYNGSETVLDALAEIEGFDPLAKASIWVARPSAEHLDRDSILPVDWQAVLTGRETTSNWSLRCGDRIFVVADGAPFPDESDEAAADEAGEQDPGTY